MKRRSLLPAAGALCLFGMLICGSGAWARDAFVMLSGGVSPMGNNYSQYLQAKAMVAYFEQNFPKDSVWVFFGAGNVEGEAPFFGDVRRKLKRDGLIMDSWLPGSLSRNRPARKEIISRAFREEILPTVARGGTLYLFVGDHGSRSRGNNAESIINLWGLEPDPASATGWRTTPNENLGVSELRNLIAQGIGKGRVVFCMTQCHSGGFHYLGVPREVFPNPRWFTVVPDYARNSYPYLLVRAAGFTATDEFTLAAGCDPDPDPDTWAGYERYVPENLLGMDLFTLEKNARGLRSFGEAHAAASLVDATIDHPYASSEQYLERWATLIETRLAKETNATPRLKAAVEAYHRAVDGAGPASRDRLLAERQRQFKSYIDAMVELNPSTRELLVSGSRKDLEAAISGNRARPAAQSTSNQPVSQAESPTTAQTTPPAPAQPNTQTPAPANRRGGTNAQLTEARKLWKEIVMPAWKKAVEAGQTPELPAAAVDFEKHLLAREAQGRDFFHLTDARMIENEIFWQSGYSKPQTLDRTRAEAVARWGLERRGKILAWAKRAEEDGVRQASEKLAAVRTFRPPTYTPPQPGSGPAPKRQISRKIAAERTLFYRRVIAAWEFLESMDERQAIAEVRELTRLEQQLLPLSSRELRLDKRHTGTARGGSKLLTFAQP